MSKRRHNFGTKRFKEKSLFIFHARIALKSLILLFVRLIARGARIGKTHTHTHTHTHTDRQDKYCNPRACAPRVNYTCIYMYYKKLYIFFYINKHNYYILYLFLDISARPSCMYSTYIAKYFYCFCCIYVFGILYF